MANVVVDASVLIAVVTNEAEKARLVRLTQDVDLIAPHSIHWEIGNAFSAMLKRRRITVEDAIRAIDLYQKIPVRFVDVEIEEAIRLADVLNIYAYDAYLVRCAIKYNSPLLSLDQGLVQSAKSAKAQVLEVTA
ncbi:MAG: type II toxin-antitoxin system VapC family toxin [Ardenticatenaceae bacterium]|nr:type II toxin-antitoxin system VapC family toxin [Ardenticatenaceae bacterium]